MIIVLIMVALWIIADYHDVCFDWTKKRELIVFFTINRKRGFKVLFKA